PGPALSGAAPMARWSRPERPPPNPVHIAAQAPACQGAAVPGQGRKIAESMRLSRPMSQHSRQGCPERFSRFCRSTFDGKNYAAKAKVEKPVSNRKHI